MLPKSVHNMFELQQGWQLHTGGAIALSLLGQTPNESRKVQFSRYLILASLDLAVATYFGRNDRSVTVTEWSPGRWSIKEVHYLFLPAVDDDALNKCEKAFAEPDSAFVIVPPKCELLLLKALENHRKGAIPHVKSFDGFLSWRELCAGMDAKWSRNRVMRYLFVRYNFHVRVAGLGSSMMIRLPPKL